MTRSVLAVALCVGALGSLGCRGKYIRATTGEKVARTPER
jgi:hypothetical protein